MENQIKTDINVTTGEVTTEPMTAKEIETREANAQAQTDREQAAEQATQDAIAHAKSLGFTDAMIAVMNPNLAA